MSNVDEMLALLYEDLRIVRGHTDAAIIQLKNIVRDLAAENRQRWTIAEDVGRLKEIAQTLDKFEQARARICERIDALEQLGDQPCKKKSP